MSLGIGCIHIVSSEQLNCHMLRCGKRTAAYRIQQSLCGQKSHLIAVRDDSRIYLAVTNIAPQKKVAVTAHQHDRVAEAASLDRQNRSFSCCCTNREQSFQTRKSIQHFAGILLRFRNE